MRPTVIQMAMEIAHTAAKRSEDAWTQVGAVALTNDNRVIAVAYNGLLPGYDMQQIIQAHRTSHGSLTLRDFRRPFMVHAEQNLASLIKRGEATKCVTTVRPCSSCLLLLASHGITEIYYDREYETDPVAETVAKFYNLKLIYAPTTIVSTSE